MGYNKENYRRVREAYQNRYREVYADSERRVAEVHAKSPELAALDKQLNATWAKIAAATLGRGDEAAGELGRIREENERLTAKREALLRELGYPADYTAPHYECEKCRDTGYVGTDMCECMKKKLVLAGYESSGLGKLMATQRFDNFDLSYYEGKMVDVMRSNLKTMREYADDFDPATSKNLLLAGGTGLGKTHLSTAVARRVIDRGYDVYYTGAVAMISDFERQRFGQGLTETSVADTDRYFACDLLIVDDLGTEMANQFTATCLYTVINERINRRLPTIVNTNLMSKELQARYDDRIFSRLVGEFLPLVFGGTDVRRQKLSR